MLTNARRYVRIAVGQPPDGFNNRLRFDLAALGVVLQTMARAPLFICCHQSPADLIPVVAVSSLLEQRSSILLQDTTRIANNRQSVGNGFRNGRRIDNQYAAPSRSDST